MAKTAQWKQPSTCDADMAWCANPLVGWLLTEGWNITDLQTSQYVESPIAAILDSAATK